MDDTFKVLHLDTWNATDTLIVPYIKTPIQQTYFTNNSDLIGDGLRQSIIYFLNTIDSLDRTNCIIGNEFRSTRTHQQTTSNISNKLEITIYAPIAFEHIRTAIGITRADFQASFSNGDLINFVNTGRSGSGMYKTQDDAYIVKTLREHEAKLLMQILPGLYFSYSTTSSLMTRYVGLYSVTMRSTFQSEIYCVIMLNNIPSIVDIDELYDLKGSSVNRLSSINFPEKRLKALKDIDFESFYPHGIRIPNEIYRRLRLTLENDIFNLKKLMITDFSLMLGVYDLDQSLKTDEYSENSPSSLKLKPQLGISSLFAATNIDRTSIESNQNNQINKNTNTSKTLCPSKFIMKPLHLLACPQANTFNGSKIASSLLGIPGLTHDNHRVLLYPSLIDCLQTYDNFKRMQNVIQNIRDPKRGSEYSVIHPDEYEKRLVRFLFEKVFIDSKQTVHQLLDSSVLTNSIVRKSSDDNIEEQDQSFVQRTAF